MMLVVQFVMCMKIQNMTASVAAALVMLVQHLDLVCNYSCYDSCLFLMMQFNIIVKPGFILYYYTFNKQVNFGRKIYYWVLSRMFDVTSPFFSVDYSGSFYIDDTLQTKKINITVLFIAHWCIFIG